MRGANHMKRKLQSLVALVLAGLSFPVAAQVVSVEARGTDQAVAEANARVKATREVMLAITEDKFVKTHTKEIRSGVIARADSFVRDFKIVRTAKDQNSVTVAAEVDVDRTGLAAYLTSIGAVIVPSYQDLLDERTGQYAAGLKAVFGGEPMQRVESQPFPARASATAVTEILDPGAEFSVTGRKVAAGGIVTYHYMLPERSEQISRDSRTHIILTSPDAPLDYAAASEARLNNDVSTNSQPEGFGSLRVPSREGSYELRMYAEHKKEHTLVARTGITVTPGELPRLSIARSRFLPEEKFSVQISQFDTAPEAQAYIVPVAEADLPWTKINSLDKSSTLRNYGQSVFTMRAPKEPGDYAILLFDFCDGCSYNENDSKKIQAASRIDFRVAAAPAESPADAFVAVPPEIASGSYPEFIAGCGPEWKSEKAWLAVRRKGAERESSGNWIDCREQNFQALQLSQLYELGDYEVSLSQGRGEEQKTRIASFRVVENPADADRQVSLFTDTDTVEQNTGISVYGSAMVHWDDPLLVMVPRGFSKSIGDVLTYAGNNWTGLGHTRDFMANFSITQKPGDYELRMYSSRSESGVLQAAIPMHVMTDGEMKAHQQKIRSELDRYISAPETESQDFKKRFLEQFLVPEPDRKADLVTRTLAEVGDDGKVRLPMTPIALSNADCSKSIDEEIRRMSFVDITLGRDGDFENELKRFGMTVLTNIPLADGSKIKKVYDGILEAKDVYGDTIAGLDQLSEEDYMGALQTSMGMILKGVLNHCEEKCMMKLLTNNSSALRERMARMTDKQFADTYNTLNEAIGSSPKGRKMLEDLSAHRKNVAKSLKNSDKEKELAKNVMDVSEDVSTLLGKMAGGDYTDKGAYANAVLAIVGLKFPVAVGSVKLSYQAYLSTKDFVRDVSVIRMYGKWKKVGGDTKGSLGYEDFARIWKDDLQHHKDRVMRQAREVMMKTMGNELTRKAFSKANRRRAQEYMNILQEEGFEAAQEYIISSDLISDEEVYDFLENQFRAWEQAENRGSTFASKARDLKNDFLKLKTADRKDCQMDFNNWHQGILDEAGKDQGMGTRIDNYLSDRVSSLWNRGCPGEVAAFKSYFKARRQIESELKRWARGSRTCKEKQIRAQANDMMCALAKSRDDYLKKAAEFACDCDVESLVTDGRIVVGRELKQYKNEAAIVSVMTALDNDSVLGCLCNYGRVSHGHASGTVGISFNPGATGMAPGGVCGENQRGACFASGWSCWHFTMPTDHEGLAKCGYYKTIKEAKDQKSLKGLSPEQMCDSEYQQVMDRAQEMRKRKRQEELERNGHL